ncbi:DMRTA motif [Nesidiocoris tenuis]|uniref:DMRTA motif n=1 Tax=Nesidiocoris tenuis TaxID=355587 RepID=A0ABN7AWL6_9HEMI|nr:DMRTA motif [Nesidiocoris tenuis]
MASSHGSKATKKIAFPVRLSAKCGLIAERQRVMAKQVALKATSGRRQSGAQFEPSCYGKKIQILAAGSNSFFVATTDPAETSLSKHRGRKRRSAKRRANLEVLMKLCPDRKRSVLELVFSRCDEQLMSAIEICLTSLKDREQPNGEPHEEQRNSAFSPPAAHQSSRPPLPPPPPHLLNPCISPYPSLPILRCPNFSFNSVLLPPPHDLMCEQCNKKE